LKLALFCLLAGVLPAWSETRGATMDPIALYVKFQHEPAPAVTVALHQELSLIMGPIGLDFEWRDLASAGYEVSTELAVVSFLGHCDTGGMNARSRFEGALGWTHMSDGQLLPFTDVNCDRVREFTQNGLLALRAGERDAQYGRALARVLAHELYHIFANTTHHGAMGVAKECYSLADLMSLDFQFREKEIHLLQSGRPKPHTEAAAPARSAAAESHTGTY
jgi:hypothetical protein